jgi:dihydropteroate synthase
MGILNVTPDSFHEGGRHLAPGAALARAREVQAQGADILDIGAESTRPGAAPVTWKQEWSRLEPVLELLRRKEARFKLPISVDTRRWQVAELALEKGAEIVNDVAGMKDLKMRSVVAENGAGLVLMHMQGDPATMQVSPSYRDVVGEVRAFLKRRLASCLADGIPRERICLDPGIGFGKTARHNTDLLDGLGKLRSLGRPLLVGASRKSFLGKLTGRETSDRLAGSLGAEVAAVARGADIVRVHDVAETVDALRVADVVLRGPRAAEAWDQAARDRGKGDALEAGKR